MSDGSAIDVAYVGEEEGLEIAYNASVCPTTPTIDDPTSGSVDTVRRSFSLVLLVVVSMTATGLAITVCL